MSTVPFLLEELEFRCRKMLDAQARLNATPIPVDSESRKAWHWATVAVDDREAQFRAAQHAFRAARRQALSA